MKRFTLAMATWCAVLLSAVLQPAAVADDWNRKTVMSFSGPVEIPGVHLAGWGVLPAGTYVFKIMDSQSDRHIVQIFSADERTIYATILAIPNFRLKATDKTVVTFRERPAGQPEALRAWFYPGRNWGEEFVYPKAKALQIAKDTKMPVLFTPADIPLETSQPISSANEPVVAELKRAPIMAIKPSGEEVQLAEVVTPPPAQETQAAVAQTPAKSEPNEVAAAAAPQQPPDNSSLPATASFVPLAGLFGVTALAGALALRFLARQTR